MLLVQITTLVPFFFLVKLLFWFIHLEIIVRLVYSQIGLYILVTINLILAIFQLIINLVLIENSLTKNAANKRQVGTLKTCVAIEKKNSINIKKKNC